MFLEILQNSQVNTCVRVSLLKKRLWHRCPPANFAKFLRATFLQNTSGRLLLVLVIARCWAEYGKYFTSLSYFADLFHEYLGKWNNRKMREWSKIKVFDNFGDNCFIIISRSSISLPEKKKLNIKNKHVSKASEISKHATCWQ